jgi:crossover junction endodeoxyribonuclease RuvC
MITVPIQIVGLDPSLTGFGIAASSGEGLTRLHRITSKLRGHERIAFILAELTAWCQGAHLAVVERPVLGRQAAMGTAMGLIGLNHLIRQRLWEMGIPYAEVSPPTLKKFATGDASADKIAMVAAAIRRFPALDITSSDTADALWACAAGCERYGQPLAKMPATQVEALRSVYTDGKSGHSKGDPKIAWPSVAVATPMAGTAAMF